MATQYKKLSEYDLTGIPEKDILERQKYAIIVAEWNEDITVKLKNGAVDTLLNFGVKINLNYVPGTFELTYAAKKMCEENNYDAVIVLGCVIQGDTPHFDYVCQGVTYGISKLNTQPNFPPVIFGVLTVNTLEQAEDRAGGIHGNKGIEAAITAIKMANIVW